MVDKQTSGEYNMFTVKDVADQLLVSQKTVRRLIDQGKLKAHKIGQQIRISEQDLNIYLEKSRVVGETSS